MQRSFCLVISFACILLATSSAQAQTPSKSESAVCDKSWSRLKPKVEMLKRSLACGPYYSSLECQENIGYGPVVGLVGRSNGAMAGRNIKMNVPKVCNIVVSGRVFFFESVAWADCNPQLKTGADSIASALRTSNDIRTVELGQYLTEKVAQENPEMNRLAKEMSTAFTNSNVSLATKLADINEKLKPLGISVTSLGQCGYSTPAEACNKLWSLFYSHNTMDTKVKVAANVGRLAAYYATDSMVQDYNTKMATARDLLNRVKNNLITNEKQLEDLFEKASATTHKAAKQMLTDSAALITRLVPSLSKSSVLTSASSLAKVSADYLKEHSKTLKKILPFGLATALGLAGTANASEIGEDMLPLLAHHGATACAETYSRYAPASNESSTCRPNVEMNPPMIDFLNLSEAEQKQEACKYSTLETTIWKLAEKSYPPDLNLTCGSEKLVIESRFESSRSRSEFTYKGNSLASAKVTTGRLSASGYSFQLDPNKGAIVSGGIFMNGSPKFVEKGMKAEDMNGAGEDFATRQVLAYMGKDCCSNASGESCALFKTKTGTSSSGSGSNFSGGAK